MAINITMPALSPTMEEGNLAKWHVKEGDSVSSGDVIAEIETDKATMEVEAVDEGTMAKILVEEGAEGVAVNTVIAILAEEGEDVSAAAKSDGNAQAKASPEKNDSKESAQVEPSKPEQKTEKAPQENQKPAESVTGSSKKTAAQPKANGDGRIFSSPLARRMARESGIDLAALSGSGPRGRIVKSDVEAAMKGQPQSASSAQPAGEQAKAPATDDAVLKLFEEGSYELKPHDGMRKTIAKRLVESKQKIPHFYLTVDCELDALLALRRELNAAAPVKDDKPAYKISVNDLVIKAMAMSLMAVPEANASWTEKNMVYHKHADVGVAVSIPGGLITPVVRNADRKGLSEIANEMKDLAGRARERKLKPEEYQGGTTAVSNLGMFGIKDFSAVINPPHATILAVGAGEERVVVKDGAPAVATVMSATLSTDHRAVDGALGAELLQAFKSFIEKPLGMLV